MILRFRLRDAIQYYNQVSLNRPALSCCQLVKLQMDTLMKISESLTPLAHQDAPDSDIMPSRTRKSFSGSDTKAEQLVRPGGRSIDIGELANSPKKTTTAQIPPPIEEEDEWKEYFDDEGYAYWFNSRTGESSWEKPNV